MVLTQAEALDEDAPPQEWKQEAEKRQQGLCVV